MSGADALYVIRLPDGLQMDVCYCMHEKLGGGGGGD